MTDEELMAAICNGDENAYRAIVQQHINAISHYAYRMLGNRRDCEDITQETFLRLWLNAKSWQPEKSKLTTWLHRIAHNLCVDYLRKSARIDDSAELPDNSDEEANNSSQEQDEKLQKLNAAIASLPESQRSALMLCHYQNFSGKDAAAIMNISVKAVESALSRARSNLKEQLQEFLTDN